MVLPTAASISTLFSMSAIPESTFVRDAHLHASIVVVCGGTSAEAEVSRVSGQKVFEALREKYEHTYLVELNASLPLELAKIRATLVFPILHGPPGEDGSLQGMLEVLGIPYVGSGVLASALAINKPYAKRLFEANGLRTAPEVLVHQGDDLESAVRRITELIGGNVVVKPSSQGSALGVSFPANERELKYAIEVARGFGGAVLVEKRFRGKEITVGILDDHTLQALPVIEIRTPEDTWYDFEHRYTPGLSDHIIPASLPEPQYSMAQDMAMRAHRVLGCRHLSRADFVAPENEIPILLEINTLPGMTPTSLYPDAANAVGITFVDLVDRLVLAALPRP